MSYKIAHKRKVAYKKSGRYLVRRVTTNSGASDFPKQVTSGKNVVKLIVTSITGKSCLNLSKIGQLLEADSKDGGNRVHNHMMALRPGSKWL